MLTKEVVDQAKIEFLDFVKEVRDPMYQGFPFTDFTLLGVHCPSFTKMNEEDAIKIVKDLQYTVLDAGYRGNDVVFALRQNLDKEDLKREIRIYEENELGEISYLKLHDCSFTISITDFEPVVVKEFSEYEDEDYIKIFDKCLDATLPNRGYTADEITAIKRFILEQGTIDWYEEQEAEEGTLVKDLVIREKQS